MPKNEHAVSYNENEICGWCKRKATRDIGMEYASCGEHRITADIEINTHPGLYENTNPGTHPYFYEA